MGCAACERAGVEYAQRCTAPSCTCAQHELCPCCPATLPSPGCGQRRPDRCVPGGAQPPGRPCSMGGTGGTCGEQLHWHGAEIAEQHAWFCCGPSASEDVNTGNVSTAPEVWRQALNQDGGLERLERAHLPSKGWGGARSAARSRRPGNALGHGEPHQHTGARPAWTAHGQPCWQCMPCMQEGATNAHRLGKVLGAAVRQVVTVHAGQHHIPHAPVRHSLRCIYGVARQTRRGAAAPSPSAAQ